MTIDDKKKEPITCYLAIQRLNNLYTCNYDRVCYEKMDYGGSKYCRYELVRKGKRIPIHLIHKKKDNELEALFG
jgi:hypothetical protein